MGQVGLVGLSGLKERQGQRGAIFMMSATGRLRR